MKRTHMRESAFNMVKGVWRCSGAPEILGVWVEVKGRRGRGIFFHVTWQAGAMVGIEDGKRSVQEDPSK